MAWSETRLAPHELLDDGFAPEPCDLLVIGCGNILRGDDAVGPVLVRTLFTRGVPDGVRIVDGGTAGMDVAFGMRGAGRVVIIDASSTGAEPGTIYRVPAEELSDMPPIDGLHTHNFRWDHALSLSAWLLGPLRPRDITVILIEAASFDPGAELSDSVTSAMSSVIELLERDFYPPRVVITEAGYLHLPQRLAAEHFPADACVARVDGDTLVLMPLAGPGHGGLVLKQLNVAGDRSVLIHEVFGFAPTCGTFAAVWDDEQGALRVSMRATAGSDPDDRDSHGDRRGDRGGPGERPVGGLSRGPHSVRPGPAAAAGLPPRVESALGGRRRAADGGPQKAATWGTR